MNEYNMKKNKHIGRYISHLYRNGQTFINRELDKYNISSGQFMFLLELYNEDGKNQEEISENIKIDKTTTTRAIKKLEERGFIYRIKDENDKRANKIYLTEKGYEVKDKIFLVLEQWNKKIGETLTKDEEETLRNLLEKVSDNIKI